MRAVRQHETGGPDVLQVDRVESPTPEKGEILVDVRAASVNRLDTLFRAGIDMFQPPTPSIPGSDFAGTVAAVGPGVEAFAPGDRVHGATLGGRDAGTYAEQITAPVADVARLPAGVSFDEGAAIGHVGVTAWRALVDHGDLEPSKTCLIHGGSGGVGHVAVQLAAATNAFVVGTSGSETRREAVRKLGADVVLDYTDESFDEAVSDAAPDGVDVVVDAHADEYLGLDLSVLAAGGTIACLEFATETGGTAALSQRHARIGNWNEATVQFVGATNAPNVRRVLRQLTDLVDRDRLEVTIADRCDLDDAAAAHARLESDRFVGKLVLQP